MINLLIDSSIYLQEPSFSKPSILSIIKYCSIDVIQLYIPYVVQMEYQTHIQLEIDKLIKEISTTYNKLERFVQRKSVLFGMLRSIYKPDYTFFKSDPQNTWEEFKRKAKASVIPIHNNHGQRVMEAYFSGGAPFAQIKSRNDIPDAFIFSSIYDLTKEIGTLHVITADGNLSKKCEGIDGAIIHNKIDSFLKCNELQEIILRIGTTERLPMVTKVLKFLENDIFDKARPIIDMEIDIKGLNLSVIEKSMNKPEIYSAGVRDIALDYDKIVKYSDENFSIMFKATVDIEITYQLEKSLYITYDEDRVRNIRDFRDETPNFYLITEEYSIRIVGILGIHIPIDKKLDEIGTNEIEIRIEELAQQKTA